MRLRYVIALFLALGLFGAFDAWIDPLFDRLSQATAASYQGDVIYDGNLGGARVQLNLAEVCAMGESLESYLSASDAAPVIGEVRESMRSMEDIHWQTGRTTLVNVLLAKGIPSERANAAVDGLRLLQVYDREC